MRSGNIDLIDARWGTKAPFTFESTLRLGDGILDPGLFAAIMVHCGDGVRPPVSIRYIEPLSSTAVDMWLVDSAGARVAAIRLDASGSGSDAPAGSLPAYPLRDDHGILRGHVSYDDGLVRAVLAAVGKETSRVYLGAGAFVLLPYCLQPATGGHVMALSVGGAHTTADVTLAGCPCVRMDVGHDGCRVGVIKVPARSSGLSYRWLKADNVRSVNGSPVQGMQGRVWIGGCHLVLRHGVASNLRVTAGQDGIELKGVSDG